MFTDTHLDILVAVAEKGGVENAINKVSGYLQQKGFSVRVIQLVWEGVRWLPESIPFFPLSNGRGQYSLNQFVEYYTTFLAEHGKPDIILATAWPMMAIVALMSVRSLNKSGCKIISWLHAPIDRYAAAGYGGLECLKRSDAVFTLNRKTYNIIKAYDKSCNVSVVKNPVDFSKCPLQTDSGWDNKTLIFIGRLSAEKRIDIMLHAISQAKDKWVILLIGDGEQKHKLQRLSRSLHLERQVIFVGWKASPWQYVSGASALILASEYEAFPMAAIESLASGIPVISTPVDGITELITPGVNGFLYPHADTGCLADILNAIASGKLPAISPEICRKSVAAYEESIALSDFCEQLDSVMDKISVIIPCYNVEAQIARCLDSIINQTIRGVRIEIICIDDKSTDNTLAILQQYENKHPEYILLIPLEENGKQGIARNIGLQYASGNFVTFVDADDAIAPEMLQELYLNAIETSCDIVECDYREVREGQPLFVEGTGTFQHMDMHNIDTRKKFIMQYGWKTSPWGRLYRKEFLLENQIAFLEDTFMEDIYFSELCILHMDTYVRLSRTLYFYCINENGVMCSDKSADYYLDTAKVQMKTTKEAQKRGLLDACQEEYACLHFSKAFVEPIRKMTQSKISLAYKDFLFLKKSLFQFFPDFLNNIYIKDDPAPETEFYRFLLENDLSEKDFISALRMWRQ